MVFQSSICAWKTWNRMSPMPDQARSIVTKLTRAWVDALHDYAD